LLETAIERHGRVMLLAYDQGLEHGPTDFDDHQSVDPAYILNLAEQGRFTGIVLQKGLAASYYQPGKSPVPLVLKLNGRTRLAPGQDLYAPMTGTVAEAVELGAQAVGYTLYLGSAHEAQMMSELADVVRDSHERKIPVVAWMDTSSLRQDQLHRDIVAYAGRIALELGADYAQLPYSNSLPDYAWVVESAGRCKVVAPIDDSQNADEVAGLVRGVVQAGGVGITVGRQVWQAADPLAVAKPLYSALWPEGGRPHAAL
jgi:class I fructose-bisphosphate aldolase